MTDDLYSDRVRALFADPAHAGELENATRVQIDDQGVRVRLEAKTEDEVLTALRFRAWGCPHLLAASEAFCENYEGKPWTALEKFRAAEIMQTLPVPGEKLGRILVLEDAVRSLGQSVREGPGPGKDKD